ncbi:hypothetical protein L1049_004074 [Liquidambar formosana]|uniref:E3 ubiquitin-protein ligase PRT1 n=1 Tax=Liquidambar formosana TaxID=63359 RepID=A0AAP0RS38_LIQFO
MEDRPTDGADSEEISEGFLCCVCLELLYKPIVLHCGHISCFWCVHRSMSGRYESHCPICRHSYSHFPAICQMLHFLLLKMYPVAYKIRENEILEQEKKSGYFSPQFDAHVCGLHSSQELSQLGNPAHYSTTISQSNTCSDETIVLQKNCNGKLEVTRSVAVEEKNLPQYNPNGNCKQVSIANVLCAACKQLLFQPAVLNCGHVYCATCIVSPANEVLRCQVCQALHPTGFPKVCLEFDHFLEDKFPKQYSVRKDAVKIQQVHFQHESSTIRSTKASERGVNLSSEFIGEILSWWSHHGSKAHFGVGCDSCGMLPIIGDRYKCKDCVEAIGFDLCGDCYNTCSKLPGRFNQQHTPEHKFQLLRSSHDVMLSQVTVQLEGGSSENSENSSPPSIFPGDSQENAENDLAASISSNDTLEYEHD